MNNDTNYNNMRKKSFKKKYTLAAVVIALLIFALVFSWFNNEQKPDPASERIIRQFAAAQLNKDPNDLTDEDFAKITTFSFKEINQNGQPVLINKDISDIKLFEKFINLQELTLGVVNLPYKKIPKWMKILAKLGIYDLNERFALDLSPLEKLHHLREVRFIGTSIKNIEPLAKLTKLKRLWLMETQVNDLEPIKNLTNLEYLDISGTQVSDLEPIKNLKNLQFLNIQTTQVSDLEPIKNLTNLQKISIGNTNITDLEPIKNLTNMRFLLIHNIPISDLEPIRNLINLQQLHIIRCTNITDEQIDDLQKALPNLEIQR